MKLFTCLTMILSATFISSPLRAQDTDETKLNLTDTIDWNQIDWDATYCVCVAGTTSVITPHVAKVKNRDIPEDQRGSQEDAQGYCRSLNGQIDQTTDNSGKTHNAVVSSCHLEAVTAGN